MGIMVHQSEERQIRQAPIFQPCLRECMQSRGQEQSKEWQADRIYSFTLIICILAVYNQYSALSTTFTATNTGCVYFLMNYYSRPEKPLPSHCCPKKTNSLLCIAYKFNWLHQRMTPHDLKSFRLYSASFPAGGRHARRPDAVPSNQGLPTARRIQSLRQKYKGNSYCKDFLRRNQFLAMAFAQLTLRDGLREIQ